MVFVLAVAHGRDNIRICNKCERYEPMKNTLVAGFLLLLPLAVALIILAKLFQFGRAVMAPVSARFSIESEYAWVFLDMGTAAILVLVCLGLGKMAQSGRKTLRFAALEDILVDYFPRYSILRSFLRETDGSATEVVLPNPVLYSCDQEWQMGFEIDRRDHLVTLYLPDAPSVRSGSVVIVEAKKVLPLEATTVEATGYIRNLGRGMLKRLPADVYGS